MRIYISANQFKIILPYSQQIQLKYIFISYTAIYPRFQKSAYYGSIKTFNSLPACLKMTMKRIILKQQ